MNKKIEYRDVEISVFAGTFREDDAIIMFKNNLSGNIYNFTIPEFEKISRTKAFKQKYNNWYDVHMSRLARLTIKRYKEK